MSKRYKLRRRFSKELSDLQLKYCEKGFPVAIVWHEIDFEKWRKLR